MTHKLKRERSGPNRKDQTKGRQWTLWDEQIILFLINAGTIGRTQNEIHLRYGSQIDREQIMNLLETLRDQGKVDRFTVPHSSGRGKAKTVWRATTKLLEE
jgi:hypothetical protein